LEEKIKKRKKNKYKSNKKIIKKKAKGRKIGRNERLIK